MLWMARTHTCKHVKRLFDKVFTGIYLRELLFYRRFYDAIWEIFALNLNASESIFTLTSLDYL